VEGQGTTVTDTTDPTEFDLEIDTYMALNQAHDPFYVYTDAIIYEYPEWCVGMMDWTSLTYEGNLNLDVDGGTVTGDAQIIANASYGSGDLYMEDYYGGMCDMEVIDLVLDYAGYGGIFDFMSGNVDSIVDLLATEIEDEIEWWVEYNCSEW